MASLSIPYPDFVPATAIVSQNFDDNNAAIVNYVNARNSGSTAWDAVKSTGTYLGGAGTSLLPEYSFTSDPDTGMYSGGTNILQFATAGTAGPLIDATQCFQLVDGLVSAPSLRFQNATTTGFYKSAANEMSAATNGVQRVKFDANGNVYGTTSGAELGVLSTFNNIAVNSIGSSFNSITVQNNKTFTVSISSSMKLFMINLSSGDACLVTASFLTGTITLTGAVTSIVASSSPTSSQLGIFKSSSSHAISFKSGTSLTSTVTSIAILGLSGAISACTDWA